MQPDFGIPPDEVKGCGESEWPSGQSGSGRLRRRPGCSHGNLQHGEGGRGQAQPSPHPSCSRPTLTRTSSTTRGRVLGVALNGPIRSTDSQLPARRQGIFEQIPLSLTCSIVPGLIWLSRKRYIPSAGASPALTGNTCSGEAPTPISQSAVSKRLPCCLKRNLMFLPGDGELFTNRFSKEMRRRQKRVCECVCVRDIFWGSVLEVTWIKAGSSASSENRKLFLSSAGCLMLACIITRICSLLTYFADGEDAHQFP